MVQQRGRAVVAAVAWIARARAARDEAHATSGASVRAHAHRAVRCLPAGSTQAGAAHARAVSAAVVRAPALRAVDAREPHPARARAVAAIAVI